jgi:ankyrin repeat protein
MIMLDCRSEICTYSLVFLSLLQGADINAKTEEGWTALMVAAKCGNLDVCKELLGHTTKPNLQSRVVLKNHVRLLFIILCSGGQESLCFK